MKIIDFIKKNKVPTIAVSVVLVAAVALGVTFGVMKHKDNVEVKPFGEESSSEGSSSTISVPPIEGNSSVESTSSEESTSSASETIETNSTPSKAESVSSKPTTTTTKPASSTPSVSNPSTSNNNGGSTGGGNSGSSAPSTGGNTGTSTPSTGGNTGSSTPSTSTPSGGNTGSSSSSTTTEGGGWHLNITLDCENCGKEYDAALDVCPYCGTPFDPGTCPNCGRVRGDGYNGTCAAYEDPFTGKWVCQHSD